MFRNEMNVDVNSPAITTIIPATTILITATHTLVPTVMHHN